MITLYSVDEARRRVLRQAAGGEMPLPEAVRTGIRRVFGSDLEPQAVVAQIVRDVRARGDAAVRERTLRIDGVDLAALEVPRSEWDAALRRLEAELVAAMRLAAERIHAFHARQPLISWTTHELGGTLGQTVTALDRVGVYVPGGTAPLPSSLLMSAIPARVAGVPEIVVATPPGRADGRVPDVILAAAHLAGVERVFRLGGAQAIAALAFGTHSVPRVDKIVGPGNLFVTLAKQQVFGQVGLDGLAGPTETVVVADDSADPAWVAADLLAQAEHDPLAAPLLFTASRRLAEAVQVEVGRQLEGLSRAEVAAAALANRGGIVLTTDLAEAVRLADEYAPEHLCLSVADPEAWKSRIRHAGGLFVGERSFEVLGDYVAGPSHVMPTGGTARFASPLNVLDFVRLTNIIQLDPATSAWLSPAAARLALAEGLDAHANAARRRADAVVDAGPAPPASFSGLLRPDVPGMAPYHAGTTAQELAARLGRPVESLVKLDANENAYGPSPRALAAAQAAQLHRYPDAEARSLRHRLADFTGVPAGNLLLGCGADEVIDILLRALVQPGDAVVDCPPSFAMYPILAAMCGARLVDVPRREDFSLDLPAIEAAVRAEPRVKLLCLCSPNNPDGGVIPDEELHRLLKLPVLVILDEAYVEFQGASRMPWVLRHGNLAVLRTFSKWAGLAGLRVGYGAFPDWLVPHLWKFKHPYNVNAAALAAAEASLDDLEHLLGNVRRLVAERERLRSALQAFGWLQPLPSHGNFLLCRVAGRPAAGTRQALEARGILVRHFAGSPRLQDFLRLSVGRPEENEALLTALKEMS